MARGMQNEAVLNAKWKLIERIYAHAKRAAEFELVALNIDRPIEETPWLRDSRYGDGKYDARWYAVMSAKDHFIYGLAPALEDELDAFMAVVLIVGGEESPNAG